MNRTNCSYYPAIPPIYPVVISALSVVGFLVVPQSCQADVTLPGLFSDHMVLQRERPLPVWGKANTGEKVTVTFNGQSKSATTGTDGRWMVELAPQAVSTIPQTLIIRGNNEVRISDVLVGDVWLGTGQSNMDWSVSATDGKERIDQTPASAFEGIRLFKVPQVEADQPTDSINAQWMTPTNRSVMDFSATLFFFGEEIHKRLPGVPLGLVRSSVGATNAYSWISNEVRDQDPSTAYLRQWWGNVLKGWSPEKQAEADKALEDYDLQVAAYKARNENIPGNLRKPDPMGPMWSRRPSALYNGMIAPLQPFSLRGMIWYQGEWDAKRDWVKVYHGTFSSLANSWRTSWARTGNNPKLSTFPIYLVQLPSRIPGDGDFWPFMREVQSNLGTDIPNSGFVSTYDLNDGTDLHPKEKTEIGRRLARLALAKEYKQDIAFHGPLFKSASVNGSQIAVTFDVGAATLKSSDGEPLRNFEVAGEDGHYVPATAVIQDATVVVSAPEVPKPSTVRYAWMPAPTRPNFFNAQGLPANPFRTDSQPVP